MKTNQLFSSSARHRFLLLMLLTIFTCGNAWGAYTYSGTGTFNKQSTIDGDGYYVIIFTSSGAMTNSASSNYVGVNTGYNGTSSATISNPSTSVVLQVTNYDSTNKKYYINNNSGNYLYSSGDKKIAYSANNSQYWEIATVNSKARLKTAQATVVYMGYYSGSGFRPYTNSGSNVQSVSAIYKLGSSCTVAPTVGSDLTSVSTTTTSITATVPISAIGGCNITENGLVYSTSNTTPTVGGTNCTKVTVTACGSTAANKEVTISGLTCGTTYYVRGYATNDAGTSYTNVKTQATSDCPLYTITYNAGSGTCATSSWTQPSYGASTTLPEATPTATCDGWSFAGWCTSSAGDEEDNTTSPGTILTGSYTPTGNVTLHAVYTKSGGGGGEPTAYSVGDEGDFVLAADVSGTWYALPTNPTVSSGKINGEVITVSTSAGSVNYVTPANASGYVWTIADAAKGQTISDGTNYIHHANGGSSGTNLAYDASTTYTWTITSDANGLLFYGRNGDTQGSRGMLFQISDNLNRYGGYALSNKDNADYARVQILPIGSGSTTYYMTSYTCCVNVVAAPTVSATNIHYNQFTLSWTNVTGADSYNVTCTGGTPGAIQSDGTTRTCTITGLASPNTSYSWTVVATYSGTYCGATPANGSTTTAQVYAVTYNANGGTVSPLPSTVSYEAGVTVTVAAEPGSTSKSGCTFTGWNTQADGQGTHYAASGSATFTMPSSTVTLYAEWTKKKNYYVDRMHGTNDGHTVTIDDVVYNCYLREGAGYTVPTISDNTSGATTCHNEHDHLLFWVLSTSVNDDGTLKGGYTEVTPGTSKTATTDGTIYYAIWGKLAD